MPVWFVCGWQVKLCDPLVTHWPYLSTIETYVWHYKALHTCKFTFLLYNVTYIITWVDVKNSLRCHMKHFDGWCRWVSYASKWKSWHRWFAPTWKTQALFCLCHSFSLRLPETLASDVVKLVKFQLPKFVKFKCEYCFKSIYFIGRNAMHWFMSIKWLW